jgi:hypothetical protein
LFLLTSTSGTVVAEQSEEELAKQSQNPIASIISLPFQNNTGFGAGPQGETTINDFNIQPVYPLGIGKVNMINRFILPISYQGELVPDRPIEIPPGIALPEQVGRKSGLGDLSYTAFFSPAGSGGVTWGVGPSFLIPTATEGRLGSGKWSVGPAFVALAMPGKWVIGGLVQNTWSFAGDDERNDVSFFFTQYFINFNLGQGWYLTTAPIITANWEADEGNKWAIPFGGGAGRMIRIGKLPVDLQGQVFYYAKKPKNGPDWGFRLQFKMLFPK